MGRARGRICGGGLRREENANAGDAERVRQDAGKREARSYAEVAEGTEKTKSRHECLCHVGLWQDEGNEEGCSCANTAQCKTVPCSADFVRDVGIPRDHYIVRTWGAEERGGHREDEEQARVPRGIVARRRERRGIPHCEDSVRDDSRQFWRWVRTLGPACWTSTKKGQELETDRRQRSDTMVWKWGAVGCAPTTLRWMKNER